MMAGSLIFRPFSRVPSNIPVFQNSMSTYGIELHRDARWLEAIRL
jgi:hypothetical protein